MIVPTFASALPAVTRIEDCANYATAFEPFLPQLYALPTATVNALGNAEALKSLYLSTNPAISGLAFSIALMPIFLITSEINRNWSQVDRMWSILPTVYHIHYYAWAHLNGLPDERLARIALASTIWSVRLTFNYWRRGGYNIGSEDYRWALIKSYIGNIPFFLLNLAFISTVQSVLLWAVTTPAYTVLVASRLQSAPSGADNILLASIISLVLVEFIADGQQQKYQNAKHSYLKTAQVTGGYSRAQLDRGFVTSGLWRYSRHPNFAAEQSIWLLFYLWGYYTTESAWNWTAGGVIGYLGVFAGSTPLTEYITSRKYPEYKEYQARVGKFVPTLFSGGWNEQQAEKREAKKAK